MSKVTELGGAPHSGVAVEVVTMAVVEVAGVVGRQAVTTVIVEEAEVTTQAVTIAIAKVTTVAGRQEVTIVVEELVMQTGSNNDRSRSSRTSHQHGAKQRREDLSEGFKKNIRKES